MALGSNKIIAEVKRLIAQIGLNSISISVKYVLALLFFVGVAAMLFHIGQGKTLVGGVLTALFFYIFSQIRNIYLEAKLKAALVHAITGLYTTFDDLRITFRNTTSVPITIREIRFRKSAKAKTGASSITRLRYISPTYHVINRDPDEEMGDFFPHDVELPWIVRAEMHEIAEGENLTSFPDPGDFHVIPPEAGATYALWFMACKQYLEDDIEEMLMIVEYPTLLGRPRVASFRLSKRQSEFVQRFLREQMPLMEKQANEMLEHFQQTAARGKMELPGPIIRK